MKLKRKIIAVLTAGVMVVSVLATAVSASEVLEDSNGSFIAFASEVYSALRESSQATAGSWKSESKTDVSTKKNSLCGGDVGVWFYTANAGLNASFINSTDRTAEVKLWEQDGAFSADDHARTYSKGFGMYNGFYRTINTSLTYTNPNVIEQDNQVELYIEFKVNKITGDNSSSVSANVITYRFWAFEN